MELTEHNQELYKIRHSLAHILAQAVLEIQPDAELDRLWTPSRTGFYYDFRLRSLSSPEDLKDIEKIQ